MKKVVIFALIFFCILSISYSFAIENSPWVTAENENLSKLIEKGYKIISTNFVNLGMSTGFLETVYLKKDGEKLYRCFTIEHRGQNSQHHCEVCK